MKKRDEVLAAMSAEELENEKRDILEFFAISEELKKACTKLRERDDFPVELSVKIFDAVSSVAYASYLLGWRQFSIQAEQWWREHHGEEAPEA